MFTAKLKTCLHWNAFLNIYHFSYEDGFYWTRHNVQDKHLGKKNLVWSDMAWSKDRRDHRTICYIYWQTFRQKSDYTSLSLKRQLCVFIIPGFLSFYLWSQEPSSLYRQYLNERSIWDIVYVAVHSTKHRSCNLGYNLKFCYPITCFNYTKFSYTNEYANV